MRLFHDRKHEMCTKSVILSVLIMLLVAPVSGCLSSDAMADDLNHNIPDPDLRINHLQMKGTHNSYHVEPIISPTREYMYTHETLDVQASEQGVRQFEIDVWWDPRGGLRVYHNQYDSGTTCPTLENCLEVLLEWSENNPSHHTTFVWIEPKDWLEQSLEITATIQISDLLGQIEHELTQFWPDNKTITPKQIQGNYSDLGEALRIEGWPSIESGKGKTIFILLATGDMRQIYLDDFYPNGAMFPMFTSLADSPDHARGFFSLTDPVNSHSDIEDLVSSGYIVRTRADSGGEEADNNDTTRLIAALTSGAHSISTDYPAKVEGIDYWVEIPGGNPSRCNPVSAPPSCTSAFTSLVD